VSPDAGSIDGALRLAEDAVRAGPTPRGAVVLDRDGRPIGQGYDGVRAERDPAAHGEIVAIRAA
jgi:tRNA(adenine34) deaminase